MSGLRRVVVWSRGEGEMRGINAKKRYHVL
jgi:hypothetical protein